MDYISIGPIFYIWGIVNSKYIIIKTADAKN